jgi:hypothetical protein
MRGWVGFLDEMMIDRINTGAIDSEVLVELSAAALESTLQSVRTLDPSINLAPSIIETLNAFTVRENVRIAT